MSRLFGFLLAATGSFLLWGLKGFKGPFNDQMVSRDEGLTFGALLRSIAGLAFWLLVALFIGRMISRDTVTRTYRLTDDEVKKLEKQMEKKK